MVGRAPAAPLCPCPRGRRPPLPTFVPPALATLATKAPAGTRYLHEIKFDGYRIQARVENGKVRLLTRTGLDWTDEFGTGIPAELHRFPIEPRFSTVKSSWDPAMARAISPLPSGRSFGGAERPFRLLRLRSSPPRRPRSDAPSPQGSQGLAGKTGGRNRGQGALQRPFRGRRRPLVLSHACRLSLEGVVSKLKNAPYHSGRTRDWIKSKCLERQVCGGWLRPLHHLAHRHRLACARGVRGRQAALSGTGPEPASPSGSAADLHKLLSSEKTEVSPFSGKLTADEARGVTFVQPLPRGGGGVRRLDRRRPPAPRRLPRPPGGQAGHRDRTGKSF